MLAATHLGPAAQVPGHCPAGHAAPHQLVLLAGHLGQQLLRLLCGGIGEAWELLRIHRAAESTDQALAIQEGDHDPDGWGDHGSLHDGGAHVPGAGGRHGRGGMWGAFFLPRALMDTGCLGSAALPEQMHDFPPHHSRWHLFCSGVSLLGLMRSGPVHNRAFIYFFFYLENPFLRDLSHPAVCQPVLWVKVCLPQGEADSPHPFTSASM